MDIIKIAECSHELQGNGANGKWAIDVAETVLRDSLAKTGRSVADPSLDKDYRSKKLVLTAVLEVLEVLR